MKNFARLLGLGNDTIQKKHTDKMLAQQDNTLPGEDTQSIEVQKVNVEFVTPNPFQPRKIFNDDALQELSSSIKEYGIIQPLLVRPATNGYELIAGERRLRASKMAGLTEVPVIVRAMDDEEMAELAMIENLQREDLHFLEEAYGYQVLIANFGITQEEAARRLGKSQSTIANKMRLLKLPGDIQTSIVDEGLTERHARALLKIEEEEIQKSILDTIREQDLNVRETENLIEEILADISREKSKKPRKQNIVKIIRDARIFINSINKMASDIKKSGLNVTMDQDEDDDHVIISLKIPKKKA